MRADANAIEPCKTQKKQQTWMLEHMLSLNNVSLSAEGMRSSNADLLFASNVHHPCLASRLLENKARK